jgi:hypothetical protein
MKKTVIRITRHPWDSDRETALKVAFGDEVILVDHDCPFGDDPVKSVQALIAEYDGVVAIEVVAPIPVLAKLTQAKRELGHIKILRAEFARGADGRAKVVGQDAAGRDVFDFSHYEVIERVEVITRPLVATN